MPLARAGPSIRKVGGLQDRNFAQFLVDTLIAVYWCFVLLQDLCSIYNVQWRLRDRRLALAGVSSPPIGGQVFTHDWEDHTDYTVESMLDGLPEIGRKIAGKLAAKAGTGLANYFMVRRLGRRAIALLRPLEVLDRLTIPDLSTGYGRQPGDIPVVSVG